VSKQEEMFLCIARFLESGLTRTVFCKQESLSVAKFDYWLRLYRRNRAVPLPDQSKFVSVRLAPSVYSTQRTVDSSLHLHFPNGVSVSGLSSDPQLLAQLAKAWG
jgi:hypothetical protein